MPKKRRLQQDQKPDFSSTIDPRMPQQQSEFDDSDDFEYLSSHGREMSTGSVLDHSLS